MITGFLLSASLVGSCTALMYIAVIQLPWDTIALLLELRSTSVRCFSAESLQARPCVHDGCNVIVKVVHGEKTPTDDAVSAEWLEECRIVAAQQLQWLSCMVLNAAVMVYQHLHTL